MYNKEEKKSKSGEVRGKEVQKIMLFLLEVTKPILIRSFLAKEFRLEQWPSTGGPG